MALKLVTCPETAHLEAIDCLVRVNGEMMLVSCSRFASDKVQCDAQCTTMLNRRRAQAAVTPTSTATVVDR